MSDMNAATPDDQLDAPLDPQEPAKRPAGTPADGAGADDEGLAKTLTREGADAPDAADIEDPDRQL